MTQKIYQVDAFSKTLFRGNPAAVCVLESWLPDRKMQLIAMENNLAETAFVVKTQQNYQIRWFTPETEVDLCGHATLAAAYVLFSYYDKGLKNITFSSNKSGLLYVSLEKNGALSMDFPADIIKRIPPSDKLNLAIGKEPEISFKGKTDIMLIYKTEKEIRDIEPNFYEINKIEVRGIIVTAPGDKVDFVSRFFAPKCGVNEDPVTGSAHTSLTPYWSKKLNKSKLHAQQLSKRGGDLECELVGNRVVLKGYVTPYLEGLINI